MTSDEFRCTVCCDDRTLMTDDTVEHIFKIRENPEHGIEVCFSELKASDFCTIRLKDDVRNGMQLTTVAHFY